VNGYLGNNVRPCVSGCFGCSKPYPPNLVVVGDGLHTAVFGQAKLRCSRCGLRVLGDSDVRSCGFELISQVRARGARRLVSAMACSRFLRSALGIPMLRSYVFELISQDSEHCTNRQGRLVACQGKPGWISVAQGFRPFGHVALNSFLKFGQGGLVDWSRRWPALVSCVRPWGFRCFGHMSLNSFPEPLKFAPVR